jgi:hypothetical protein
MCVLRRESEPSVEIELTSVVDKKTRNMIHEFVFNIFRLIFLIEDMNAIQDIIFNNESFLPSRPAQPLPATTILRFIAATHAHRTIRLMHTWHTFT